MGIMKCFQYQQKGFLKEDTSGTEKGKF